MKSWLEASHLRDHGADPIGCLWLVRGSFSLPPDENGSGRVFFAI